VMEQGQLVEAGTHDELLAEQGIYAGLWNIQQNAKLSSR
jgi:ABC-type multidrug transport system fused ATPase/permease subunit